MPPDARTRRGPGIAAPALESIATSSPQRRDSTAYLEADWQICRKVARTFADCVAAADPKRTQDELDALTDHLVARLMVRRSS